MVSRSAQIDCPFAHGYSGDSHSLSKRLNFRNVPMPVHSLVMALCVLDHRLSMQIKLLRSPDR